MNTTAEYFISTNVQTDINSRAFEFCCKICLGSGLVCTLLQH